MVRRHPDGEFRTTWRQAHHTDAATEAGNNLNLIARINRAAFGTNLRHLRVRVLLYVGRPNWALSCRRPATLYRAKA